MSFPVWNLFISSVVCNPTNTISMAAQQGREREQAEPATISARSITFSDRTEKEAARFAKPIYSILSISLQFGCPSNCLLLELLLLGPVSAAMVAPICMLPSAQSLANMI